MKNYTNGNLLEVFLISVFVIINGIRDLFDEGLLRALFNGVMVTIVAFLINKLLRRLDVYIRARKNRKK